jgi:hypothetical protein
MKETLPQPMSFRRRCCSHRGVLTEITDCRDWTKLAFKKELEILWAAKTAASSLGASATLTPAFGLLSPSRSLAGAIHLGSRQHQLKYHFSTPAADRTMRIPA